MRFLLEEHQRPLRRSCECVGLSRAARYRPPLHWTVRDAEIIAALAKRVEDRPARGFWKGYALLRRMQPGWHHKRVDKAMRLNLRRAAKQRNLERHVRPRDLGRRS